MISDNYIKSIINDDFAWIVWEKCKQYDYAKKEDPNLDSINLTNEGIFLNGRYFKIRRHLPMKLNKIKLPLNKDTQSFISWIYEKAHVFDISYEDNVTIFIECNTNLRDKIVTKCQDFNGIAVFE